MENAIYTPEGYTDLIRQELGNCLIETNLSQGEKVHRQGTRPIRSWGSYGTHHHRSAKRLRPGAGRYPIQGAGPQHDERMVVRTDQPYCAKPGPVSVPDPNVTIAKKCTVFPIEFVVRGYITGTTSTSLWTVYQSGQRATTVASICPKA